MVLFGIAIAGALGAVARFVVDAFVTDRVSGALPLGTLVVNVSGSFLLGVITGAALYHGFATNARLVLGTGFCGGYTTFSTFTIESIVLVQQGARSPPLQPRSASHSRPSDRALTTLFALTAR
jgi:CrcB protein